MIVAISARCLRILDKFGSISRQSRRTKMEIQTERLGRIAYKHKYQTWKTIALYFMGAWIITLVFLVQGINANHKLQKRAQLIEVEVVK